MKLVLLKKLRQSQQMKENVCVPPSNAAAGSNNTGQSSSMPSPKGASSLHASLTQQPNAHNQQSLTQQQQQNHLHNLQNLQNLQNLPNLQGLHPQALQIPGVKGRASPKLTSNGPSSNGGTSRDSGLNLSHLGMSGLFANPHLAALGPIPGLNLQAPQTSHSSSSSRSNQNNIQNSNKSMSSAKVSTLLKGVCVL